MKVTCRHFFKFWRIFLIFSSFTTIYGLQAQLPSLMPPEHVQGHQSVNKFASQRDLINVITWQPPASGIKPVAYKIYRRPNLTELAVVELEMPVATCLAVIVVVPADKAVATPWLPSAFKSQELLP